MPQPFAWLQAESQKVHRPVRHENSPNDPQFVANEPLGLPAPAILHLVPGLSTRILPFYRSRVSLLVPNQNG